MRDEVELFSGPAALFGCRHVPGAGASGPGPVGVLVCSSVGPGAAASYGAEARLGRALARAGVVAQRFHYRGTGASDGSPLAIGFSSLVDDARAALDLLRERGHTSRIGFVGVRLGALVAARLAAAVDDAPVALWSPVAEPGRFLEDAALARESAAALLVDDTRTAPGAAPEADVFATRLPVELVAGAVVGGLADELGARRRHVLLVRTAMREAGDPGRDEYSALVTRWRALGVRVDTASLPVDGARDGVPVPNAPSGTLIERTASWLAERLRTPSTHSSNGDGGS